MVKMFNFMLFFFNTIKRKEEDTGFILLYLFTVFFKILFIYLFLAVLGLRCCAQAFSSCSEWGLLFVTVRGLLIVVATLVAEHGL